MIPFETTGLLRARQEVMAMQRAVGILPAEATSHNTDRFRHLGRPASTGETLAARFLLRKGLACRKGVCYEPAGP